MATISGTLKNASGVRPNTKIILTAYKTTSGVVTLAPDTTIVTSATGAYSFVCNPSFYNVRIQQPGYPCENVGIIQVYPDSVDGTINDFLTVFKPDDLTPEILKQCIDAQQSAEESARIAQEESGKVINATKLGLQVNNLHTTRDAITWKAGLYVEDPAQLYVHDGIEYLPNPKAVPFPFTTGATFDASNWVLSDIATVLKERQDLIKKLGLKVINIGEVTPPETQGEYGFVADDGTLWKTAYYQAVGITGTPTLDYFAPLGLADFTADNVQFDDCSKIQQRLVDGEHIKIMTTGDSTMWGAEPFNSLTQSAVAPSKILESSLNLIYNGQVTVIDGAFSGTNLNSLIRGQDGGVGTLTQRLAASDADVVITNHCLNDCNAKNPDGSYHQKTLDIYKKNLIIFVNTCRYHNKVPMLITPTIINPTNDGQEYQQKRMPAFIQCMRDVAHAMSVDLVDNFYYSYKSTAQFKPADIAPDGVHLSPIFYKQAGYNMCIPFVNTKTLNNHGDKIGLSTTEYADYYLDNRKINTLASSDYSCGISGSKSSLGGNVYIPIVIDTPVERDSTIIMGCVKSPTGGTGEFTYFGDNASLYRGAVSFKGDTDNGIVAPVVCSMPAGFHILGLAAVSGEINVSGFELVKRNYIQQGCNFADRLQYSKLCKNLRISVTKTITAIGSLDIVALNDYTTNDDLVRVFVVDRALKASVNGGAAVDIYTFPDPVPDTRITLAVDASSIAIYYGSLVKVIDGVDINNDFYISSNGDYGVVR